jgi:hypothetical protein
VLHWFSNASREGPFVLKFGTADSNDHQEFADCLESANLGMRDDSSWGDRP